MAASCYTLHLAAAKRFNFRKRVQL